MMQININDIIQYNKKMYKVIFIKYDDNIVLYLSDVNDNIIKLNFSSYIKILSSAEVKEYLDNKLENLYTEIKFLNE